MFQSLYNSDQGQRKNLSLIDLLLRKAGIESAAFERLRQRDVERTRYVLKRLDCLDEADSLSAYHASLILHHGFTPWHLFLAHVLARRASTDIPQAVFLARAALDRLLILAGHGQAHDTQYSDKALLSSFRKRYAHWKQLTQQECSMGRQEDGKSASFSFQVPGSFY